VKLLRWLWWATIGRFFDALCVVTTMGFLPIWYFILRPRGWGNPYKEPKPTMTVEELIALGPKDPMRDGYYSDVEDYHGLMCQVGQGYFESNPVTMEHGSITADGSLWRYVPRGLKPSDSPPSVDMLAAYCYFHIVTGSKLPALNLRDVADHFIQNIFTILDLNGRVSPRCTTGGVTFSSHPETFLRLTKPSLGQEAVVASALLALAKKELGGFKYAFFYYLHYWAHFVWFWRLFPWLPFILGTKNYAFSYVGWVCAMGLHVLQQTVGSGARGLRWCALTAKSRQGVQPYIGALANLAGVLPEREIQSALAWLLYSHPVWPEMFNLTEPDVEQKCFSMPALAAVQLTKERK